MSTHNQSQFQSKGFFANPQGEQLLFPTGNATPVATSGQAAGKENLRIPTGNATPVATFGQAAGKEVPILLPGPFYAQMAASKDKSGGSSGKPKTGALPGMNGIADQPTTPHMSDMLWAGRGIANTGMPVAQGQGAHAASPVATATLSKPTPSPLPTRGKPPVKKSSAKKGQGKVVAAVVGSVVVLLVLVAGFVLFAQSTPDVTLYKVSTGNVDNAIGGGGIIFPRQQLDISYPVAERVISVLVKAGDSVTMNQSLIQLDPSQLNAEVTQASNDLAAAQAYLDTVSASKNPLTIAQAQQQYNVAKNKYEALVAEAASPTLHHGTLISPMAGVVTAIGVNPGEVFSANTPLITIMDESSVIVHVKIPLSNLGQVQVGQSAIVIPSALPKLNLTGKVISIVPKADPQTDTFEAWIEVPNTNMTLLPGMSAFVRIQGQGQNKQALALPRLTVMNADHEPTVFVVHGEQAYLQRVHVIGRSTEVVYVDKGLAAGDRVVLVGNDRLHNGDSVHIVHVEG